MNFNTFKYLFREGLKNVFYNKKTTIASLVITCFTMIIFGVFFVALGNIEKTSDKITSQQGMEAFLVDDLTQEQTDSIEEKIKNMPGIADVRYKSKEEAFEQAVEMSEELSTMLEGYDKDYNILPPSFVITLSKTSLDNSSDIKNQVGSIEGITDIRYRADVIQKASYIEKVVKIITVFILIFSIIGSILIISNTIKITVYSRRKEISIMKYVGATDGFIRIPFLVQGAVTGLISACISTIIMIGVYKVVLNFIENSTIELLTTVSFNDMLRTLLAIFLVLGIGIGIIGSHISMKKYLEV